ncbi:MAG TPA: hypothetical protein VF516_18870, partial [Kofleriaceae bacterium]
VALVNRLLAPNPDDRPQRGQDVAAELADISRQYGLSGSAPGIAYVLSQLFPVETAGGAEPIQVTSTFIGAYDSKPTSSLPSSSLTLHGVPPASAALDLPPTPTPRVPEPSRPVALPPPSPVPVPVSRPQVVPPVSLPSLIPPVRPSVRPSFSVVKLLVTLAVAILLAVGMYMLVRPS